MKKSKNKTCLQVDFENGDCPELYPIDDPESVADFINILTQWEHEVKVQIVTLTPAAWKKAVKIGKELA